MRSTFCTELNLRILNEKRWEGEDETVAGNCEVVSVFGPHLLGDAFHHCLAAKRWKQPIARRKLKSYKKDQVLENSNKCGSCDSCKQCESELFERKCKSHRCRQVQDWQLQETEKYQVEIFVNGYICLYLPADILIFVCWYICCICWHIMFKYSKASHIALNLAIVSQPPKQPGERETTNIVLNISCCLLTLLQSFFCLSAAINQLYLSNLDRRLFVVLANYQCVSCRNSYFLAAPKWFCLLFTFLATTS